MSAPYIYSISLNTKNAILNAADLNGEILASSIQKTIEAVYSDSDQLTVEFQSSLDTTEKNTLDAIVAAHEGNPPQSEDVLQEVTIAATPAFANKTIDGKKIYQRVTGESYSVVTGANIHTFTIPYAACKINGVELINGEIGDSVTFSILDTASGTLTTIPNYNLNSFGINVNVAKDFYRHMSDYDADLFAGLQIEVEYISVSNKTLYVNYHLHEVK